MSYTIKYNKALLKYEDKQRFVEITASSKSKGTVVVHYTFDEWKTTRNKTGIVVSNKDNDFLYRISIPINSVANVKMWFSVKFSVNINNTNKEVWDNNNGWNYEVLTEKLPKICLPSPTKAVTPQAVYPQAVNPLVKTTNPAPPKSRSPSPPSTPSCTPSPAPPTKINPVLPNFKAAPFFPISFPTKTYPAPPTKSRSPSPPSTNKSILVVKVESPIQNCTTNLYNPNDINAIYNYNNNSTVTYDADKLQGDIFNKIISSKINTLYSNSENNFPLIKFSRGGYSIPTFIDTRKPVMNKEIRAA